MLTGAALLQFHSGGEPAIVRRSETGGAPIFRTRPFGCDQFVQLPDVARNASDHGRRPLDLGPLDLVPWRNVWFSRQKLSKKNIRAVAYSWFRIFLEYAFVSRVLSAERVTARGVFQPP